VWPFSLSARLPIADLVGRYLTNYLMGREPLLLRIAPLTSLSCDSVVLCGISNRFRLLSPSKGQVAHALLTRSPLSIIHAPFDLHVLGTPPAFVLSQDQTLELNSSTVFNCLLLLNWLLISSKPLSVLLLVPQIHCVLFLALYSSQGAARCPFSSLSVTRSPRQLV